MNFIKTAAVCPSLRVAEPDHNAEVIIDLLNQLNKEKVQAAVFPELSITGYTCADLFFQEQLLHETREAIEKIQRASQGSNLFFAVGAPLRIGRHLYNCAVAIQNGKVLGIVPKTYLANTNEAYEKRWFSTLPECEPISFIPWNQGTVPFGKVLFHASGVRFGLELSEDLWVPVPPSTDLALAGAQVILNLAASTEFIAKADYRRQLVESQSARLFSGYVYASAGVGESTTDVVFSGHLMIGENGHLLAENKRFQTESEIITAWIDVDRLNQDRIRQTGFRDSYPQQQIYELSIDLPLPSLSEFDRPINSLPFIPENPNQMVERCREIFAIQAHGLAKRLRAIGTNQCVIGISGGLDSTLALLVIRKALEINNAPPEGILTVTMPGFGTTDRTYQNAVNLCKQMGTDFREINIVDAALQHFRDIGHDPSLHDSTYENTQARERTQILMDLANKEGGIVIGTGDLSELALGWATYNGDHMSMYGVNASIPKTLVRYLVRYAADYEFDETIGKILHDIVDTPISPELLPSDKDGKISQVTEDLIGPYELSDFFLYHMLRFGTKPEKILFLAKHAFKEEYDDDTLKKWLKVFIRRFFNNQFKRSALPDGPKVGSVALSPRGDWRMPSDVSYKAWLKVLED